MNDSIPDSERQLAQARQDLQQGNTAAARSLVDQVLAVEPRNFRALLLRGDVQAALKDDRGASVFYRHALKLAPPANTTPAELRVDLERAATRAAAYSAKFESHLSQALARRGYVAQQSSPRFSESLDLLLGRKQVQLQQPRVYYFPGLPQLAFYGREQFDWLEQLEAATADIRAEAAALMSDAAAFTPYVAGDARHPRYDQSGLYRNPAWSSFYLWKNGQLEADNAARCPATMRALASVPLAHMQNRSPSVLFSLLRAGTHIPPHTGMLNTRLICHLPLIVPGQCTFRVGNHTREWVEGKAWLFDDTIEHEAWNRSSHDRVILLFEVWKPELDAAERTLVCSLFEGVDEHSGEKPAWEI